MVGRAPLKRSVRPEAFLEPRLDVRTSLIGQHEEGFAGKPGAAKKYVDLRKRQPRPVEGDPRAVTDDHEPTVPVPARAMRRKTKQFCVQRQKVVPKGAILRQILAGDCHLGGSILHVRQFGILTPWPGASGLSHIRKQLEEEWPIPPCAYSDGYQPVIPTQSSR